MFNNEHGNLDYNYHIIIGNSYILHTISKYKKTKNTFNVLKHIQAIQCFMYLLMHLRK